MNLKELIIYIIQFLRSPKSVAVIIGGALSAMVYFYLTDKLLPPEYLISNQNNTIYFFSDNTVDENSSTYGKIARKITENNDIVAIRGKHGTAIENAYGVICNKKSFGIIQSDTYTAVKTLKDKNYQIVSPLYMERLHILVRHGERLKKKLGNDPGMKNDLLTTENLKKISKLDPKTIQIYCSGISSSAWHLLPFLFEIADANYDIRNINTREPINKLLQEDSFPDNEISIVFFVEGTSKVVNELFEKDSNWKLFGLDVEFYQKLNNSYNQDVELVYWDDEYGDKNMQTPTIGSMAQLISSKDITAREKADILDRINNIATSDQFRWVFSNPKINFKSKADQYRHQANGKKSQKITRILIFVLSLIIFTLIFSSIILQMISKWHQENHYRKMMKMYDKISSEIFESIPRQKFDYHTERKLSKYMNHQYIDKPDLEKCDLDKEYERNLFMASSMKALQITAYEVRTDYKMGGLTSSHHDHLMQNINDILQWLQQVYAKKIIFCLEQLAVKEAKNYKIMLKKYKELISKWLSQDYITVEDFTYMQAIMQRKKPKGKENK